MWYYISHFTYEPAYFWFGVCARTHIGVFLRSSWPKIGIPKHSRDGEIVAQTEVDKVRLDKAALDESNQFILTWSAELVTLTVSIKFEFVYIQYINKERYFEQ